MNIRNIYEILLLIFLCMNKKFIFLIDDIVLFLFYVKIFFGRYDVRGMD